MSLSIGKISLIPFLSLLTLSPTASAANHDLSLTLSASPNPAAAGETVTYTLIVTNNGSKPARKVVAANPLPADAQLVSFPPDCRPAHNRGQPADKLVCKAKRLAPGQSVSWSFSVQIGESGIMPTTATVKSDKRDANPANNRMALSSSDPGPDQAPAQVDPPPPSPTGTTPPSDDGHEPEHATPTQPTTDEIATPDMRANTVRESHPDAQADEIRAIATANIALAFDLYAAYKQNNTGNFAYSVPAIAQSLAMLAAGANGSTLSALLGALHVDLQESRLHPAFNGSALDLSGRNPTAHLHLNAALWGQGGSQDHNQAHYLFDAGFLDTLEKHYGPKLAAVDYTAEPNAPILTDTIDPWLAAHSQGSITGLVTSLSPRTRLATASSLSLNGAWQTPPDANPAVEGRFELSSSDQVLVPMLNFTGQFPYTEGDGYRAFELPLADGDLALWVLMPDHGRFAEFQSAFNSDQLNNILAAMTPTRKTLYLPKIAITSDLPSGALAALALSGPLTEGQADFSRVNGEGYLFLDTLSHRSVVTLTENTAQADGATMTLHLADKNEPDSVWSSYGSYTDTTTWVDFCAPVPHYDSSLALARPFLFAIRDRVGGSILFMGQLVNPGGAPAAPDSTTYPCAVHLITGG